MKIWSWYCWSSSSQFLPEVLHFVYMKWWSRADAMLKIFKYLANLKSYAFFIESLEIICMKWGFTFFSNFYLNLYPLNYLLDSDDNSLMNYTLVMTPILFACWLIVQVVFLLYTFLICWGGGFSFVFFWCTLGCTWDWWRALPHKLICNTVAAKNNWTISYLLLNR